ncbi:membrane protein [Helicobacter acinonychis]|nr:membrane protein [Helicobacter acinonychis]
MACVLRSYPYSSQKPRQEAPLASASVYFFSFLVIVAATRNSESDWLLMLEHLIWFF